MDQAGDGGMPRPAMPGVRDNIVETIGGTPLVRLHGVARGVRADVLAKVESFNPGGSVKDRIGLNIVEAAEREGRLRPGGTIVEPTSGNTGVGLAIVAALRGYKTIFVMPDKMSDEKIRLLRAYGARVVITPTAVEPDDPRSYYSVADRLARETPGAILGNQYHNPANPESHYRSTGPELWDQTAGRVTHFVCCMGTGGTISGTGRYLKERNGAVQVVGVDPVGSILRDLFYTGTHGPAEGYLVEGFGEDFLPTTTDFSVIDDVVQVTDAECFGMARRLVREEGIFGGGSCGAAVAGALRYARERDLGPDAVMVVLLPDSGSRYLSKVFNDDWMREHGFEVDDGPPGVVADLLAALGERPVITASATARIQDVVLLMKHHDISQVPVLDDAGVLVGSVSERGLLQYMLDPAHDRGPEATIAPVVSDRIAEVRPDTTLAALGHLFADRNIAAVRTNGHVGAVITKIDLIDFLTQRERAARG
ncbi:cystathionine beta-synthase [bacterium]|nr:cystathionine beta-synthase [Chloroflexi bacterium CFX6]RIL12446.1 MAG: cystathionine beta-synthase [bacterium]